MSGIWVQGLNDLVVDLAAEATVTPERSRVVVQASARAIRDTMESFAPVDEGEMRESISYETKLLPGGATAEIGPTATRDGFPYPMAVEYGTSRMAPQPFAGPALDRHSSDFVTAMLQVSRL